MAPSLPTGARGSERGSLVGHLAVNRIVAEIFAQPLPTGHRLQRVPEELVRGGEQLPARIFASISNRPV